MGVSTNDLNDGLVALCMKLVKQVCNEYKTALKKNDYSKAKALEHWFYGPDFDMWSLGMFDADYIITRIRRQVEAETKRQLKRSVGEYGNDKRD